MDLEDDGKIQDKEEYENLDESDTADSPQEEIILEDELQNVRYSECFNENDFSMGVVNIRVVFTPKLPLSKRNTVNKIIPLSLTSLCSMSVLCHICFLQDQTAMHCTKIA